METENKTSNLFFNVIIPTFNRTQWAKQAINSVLRVGDSRIGVVCNSNGPDPELRSFCEGQSRVVYSEFDENLGVHTNMRFVLESSAAVFSMYMSDEDQVVERTLLELVNWLAEGDNNAICGLCGVSRTNPNPIKKRRFLLRSRPVLQIGNFDLFAQSENGYLSGWVYKGSAITKEILKIGFEKSEVNAYPHLEMGLHLASKGRFFKFSEATILRGDHAEQGGGTFEDVEDRKSHEKPLMNARVFGFSARVAQFQYRYEKICLYKRLYGFRYLFRVWRLCVWFAMAALSGRESCGQADRSKRALLEEGLRIAERNGVNRKAFWHYLFRVLLFFPFRTLRRVDKLTARVGALRRHFESVFY